MLNIPLLNIFMEDILSKKIGKKIIFMGNEAIVRGALESGVQFVSTYPGTPSSEIGIVFFQLTKKGLKVPYFEFSTNEKVALEAGIGASFSGLKTLVAMKNFGLNVCSDALLPFCYTGTRGPTVIIVADDPNCWSSAQSEENSRPYAYLAHIPILEPSDSQECKDFVKLAFDISEKFNIPVMVRTTTRVAHQRGIVRLANLNLKKKEGKFIKNTRKFVTMPPRVLEMKKELLEKIKKIKDLAEKSKINQISKNSNISRSNLGVITSGISYLYVKEASKILNLNLPILKLGFFYPLPEKKIKNFIKDLKKVLIVEELEPFLENEVERLAKDSNARLQILGKNLLLEVGELKPEYVTQALARFVGKKYKIPKSFLDFPKRFPQLCPGCPYRFVLGGIKRAVNEQKVIFGGDIGCYMLAGLPPYYLQDYLSCMGSSIGIAHGIKKATDQKLITLIGDSTFFHAGIPALINTVFNKSNPLIIIMDNQTTAMTGHQPHPGAPAENKGLKIEEIVSACGVKNLKVIDPVNSKEFEATIKEFLNKKEASVIIARHPCVFVAKRK